MREFFEIELAFLPIGQALKLSLEDPSRCGRWKGHPVTQEKYDIFGLILNFLLSEFGQQLSLSRLVPKTRVYLEGRRDENLVGGKGIQ